MCICLRKNVSSSLCTTDSGALTRRAPVGRVRHVLHEYPTLQLQSGLAALVHLERLASILGLVHVNLLAAEKDFLEQVHAVLALVLLVVRIALEHSVSTVKQKFTKGFDAVVLPILDLCLEVLDGLLTILSVERSVGAVQDRRDCLNGQSEIFLEWLAQVALVSQLLRKRTLDKTSPPLEKKAHLEQQRIFGQPLKRLEEKRGQVSRRFNHLPDFGRTTCEPQLVEFAHRRLFAASLILNEGLIYAEGLHSSGLGGDLSVCVEQASPVLIDLMLSVRLFNTNEEAALEFEQLVQVQENVVDRIARYDSGLANVTRESLEQLQMLDICALSAHKLVENVLPMGALGTRDHACAIIIAVERGKQASLDKHVDDPANLSDNL